MAVYTVHEPPLRSGTTSPEPEGFVFVRDGFSFWALLFGPLWMLRHRIWLVLLCYVAVVAALSAVVHLIGLAGIAPVVWTLLAFLIGFEPGPCDAFRCGVAASATSESWSGMTSSWPSGASSTHGSAGIRRRARMVGQTSRLHRGAAPAACLPGCARPVSPARVRAMSVAIVDYGSGNLHSAAKAFERAARECGYGERSW